MKKIAGLVLVLLITLLCTAALADVEINETNFPDANFRQYLLDVVDQFPDGLLEETEIDALLALDVTNRQIMSLNGIHFFQPTCLLASYNKLTSIDLSNNRNIVTLDLCNNQLNELDLKGLDQVQEIACHQNSLNQLNLPESNMLNYLDCGQNNLSTIDLSRCPNLQTLAVSENPLTFLDLSNNSLLTRLELVSTQIDRLDATELSKLVILSISNTLITDIDLQNCPDLEELWAQNLNLYLLDLHNNKKLKLLACEFSEIQEIDLSANTQLKTLQLSCNRLKKLNLNHNTELTRLECGENDLKTLDLSNHAKLTYIDCHTNPRLNALNISTCSQLEELDCCCCNLSSIYLTHNPVLKRLSCWKNDIVEIDISQCAAINELVKSTEPGMHVHDQYYGWGKDTDGDGFEDVYLYIDRSTSVKTDTGIISGESVESPSPTSEPAVTPAPTPTVVAVGVLKYKLSGSNAIVTGPKNKNAKKLTIPKTIKANGKTYKVTEIKASAFKGMKKLTAITIGANVKTIGKAAFQNCAKLKTITVKTTKLTNSSVKANAFKGIYKKATFKCPKSKLAAYKKLFVKKGAAKTCKFK